MSDLKFRVVFEALDKITEPFRRARQTTDGLAEGVSSARAELKRLATQAKALDQLEKLVEVKRAAQEAAAGLREDIARWKHWQTEVEAGSTEWKRYQRSIERAEAQIQKTEARVVRAATSLTDLRDRLRQGGIATGSLSEAQADLKTKTTAANAALDKQAAALSKVQGKAKALAEARAKMDASLGRATGMAASGLAAVTAGREGLTALDSFTADAKQAQHTRAAFGLTAGIDDAKIEDVRQRVKALAVEANQYAEQVQEGVGILVSKGMDVDPALVAMGAVGRAATATGADVTDLSNLTFSAMDNLKVPAEEAAKALDIMAKAGDLGGFELKDMARTFPQLTASAAALGLTGTRAIGTLSAALQVATKGAATTDEAANNMANFLAKITAPETVKRFDEFGIDIKKAMTTAVAKGENPFDVMLKNIGKAVGADLEKEMDDALKNGLNPEQAAAALGERFKLGNLFGDMQVLNALGPLLANMGEFRRIRDAAMGAEGTVNAKFAAMMRTSQEIEKASTVAWQNLKETLGTGLLPILNQGMAALRDLMVRVDAWAGKNPETARTILLVAGGLATVIAVGGALAVVLAGLVAPIAALQFAFGVLNVVLAACPLMWIVIGIAAVIGAVAAMIFYWKQCAAVFNAVWEGIKTALMFSPLGLISAAWKPVTAFFKGEIGSWGEFVDAFFGQFADRIKSLWGAMKGVREAFSSLWSDTPEVALKMRDMDIPTLDVPPPVPLASVPAGSVTAAAPAPASTTTNTITINAAPGMDERQLADEVARQLREKEARDRARARSDFSDPYL